MKLSQKNQPPVGGGTGLNQIGRFESTEVDWSQLEESNEPDRPKTQNFADTSRTGISENDSPDIPYRYSLNPYRGCLQVAVEARQPMSIITKNALVRRDLDLMTQLVSQNLIRVAISITSLDQSLTKLLEPATSAPAARLQAVRELSSAGIPVHIMVAPVIPGLNDSEIPAILEAAAEAGARTASHILLRLPHSVKDIFADWLNHRKPTHAEKVLTRLAAAREGKLNNTEFGKRMRGSGPLAEQIVDLFKVSARRFGIDQKLSALATDHFRVPDGQGRLF
jgi:DNA repair photolyase